MRQSMAAQRAAVVSEGMHLIPVRRWHPTGHQVSIWSSLFIAAAIGVFFICHAGVEPAA